MAYWLVKSEPEEYSYDMLVRDGKAVWTGVRGFQAMKNMRAMKPGDTAFFYHTGEQKAIVGICTVLSDYFVDPTSEDDGPWVALEIGPVRKVTRPVTLSEVKADPRLQNTALAREPRLSVQPLTDEEYNHILALTETDAAPAPEKPSSSNSVRQTQSQEKPSAKTPPPAPRAKTAVVHKVKTPLVKTKPSGKTKSAVKQAPKKAKPTAKKKAKAAAKPKAKKKSAKAGRRGK